MNQTKDKVGDSIVDDKINRKYYLHILNHKYVKISSVYYFINDQDYLRVIEVVFEFMLASVEHKSFVTLGFTSKYIEV